MVDESRLGASVGDSHAESIDDDIGLEVVTHRPAAHPAGTYTHDHRQEEPAFPGGHIGDVGDPELEA